MDDSTRNDESSIDSQVIKVIIF